MKTDPRVDAYIARQAEFARPILAHLRGVIHEACPDCEETLKWSMPSFIYKGKILAGFRGVQSACGLRLLERFDAQPGREESLGDGPVRTADRARRPAGPGDPGRLTRKSMALIDEGAKPPRIDREEAALHRPAGFARRDRRRAGGEGVFDGFAPSCQREYVEWVTEAKRDETRAKGSTRRSNGSPKARSGNWKYENC